ncbi:MAG: tRNA 2-thiouridine(34) synthase MnmA [Candidatus Omnitrophota bacterium]|nr:MAG: tRNA 2-thiouridine(34) synthase MnmA [Candidatus Omnitrophota bacterium]
MKRKKVVIAMSGGVDSSVAASLLKDEGFEVIGLTMQMTKDSRLEEARAQGRRLGIPHYVLNLEDIFKERVISDFCEEYKRGHTPNPCVRCNKYIKFDTLIRKAGALGADYIATGHYTCIEHNGQRHLLKRGIDSRKDQSYFLYLMNEEELERTLMPLGNLTKEQVREIARKKDLPAAESTESQEICFIPNNRYGEFLKEYIPEELYRPGPILRKGGEVIGEHQGIIFYTVGQRKGIGLSHKEPLYVSSIDRENNSIVVGLKQELYKDELIVDNVSFIYGGRLEAHLEAEVKIRYLHLAAPASIIPQGKEKAKVRFAHPQWAPAPGQSAVFYQGDVVIGGGRIC